MSSTHSHTHKHMHTSITFWIGPHLVAHEHCPRPVRLADQTQRHASPCTPSSTLFQCASIHEHALVMLSALPSLWSLPSTLLEERRHSCVSTSSVLHPPPPPRQQRNHAPCQNMSATPRSSLAIVMHSCNRHYSVLTLLILRVSMSMYNLMRRDDVPHMQT